MAEIPQWYIAGDWFDVCRGNIPCPCGFAQPPTNNACSGVLAYHIREGIYGDVRLDGLNYLATGSFEGNLWTGPTNIKRGFFIDERANEQQREALQIIFSDQAGGWKATFTALFGELHPLGAEVVPIHFEVADDLAFWRAEVPGKVIAQAEVALQGVDPKQSSRTKGITS